MEYAANSGIIIALVAALSGISDIFMELLLGSVAAICGVLAWGVEAMPRKGEMHLVAWGLLLVNTSGWCMVWIVIAYYFFNGAQYFSGRTVSSPYLTSIACVFVANICTFVGSSILLANCGLSRFFGFYSMRTSDGVATVASYFTNTILAFSVIAGGKLNSVPPNSTMFSTSTDSSVSNLL